MSESQQPNTGHAATFEAGPAENVAGKEHQLIYVRADTVATPADLRTIALQVAANVESRTFRGADEHVDPAADVVNTAKMFLAFLEDGAA